MNSNTALRARVLAKQDESAAGIGRDSNHRSDPHLLVGEFVFVPCQAFVCRIEKEVGRFFIVDEDEKGAGVTKAPHMGIFVNLFPSKATIAGEECVRVDIWLKMLANVSNGHDEPGDGGARICRTGIATFCIAMEMKATLL